MEQLLHYAPLAAALYMFFVVSFITYREPNAAKLFAWRFVPIVLAVLLLLPSVK